MPNCGNTCGQYWGKVMEKVRENLLKNQEFSNRGLKPAKKSNIYTLDLHRLIQKCAKEMVDYKIKTTESTFST